MVVRLVALGPDDDGALDAALRLRTAPEQARFALLPAESFPLALADPARTPFVVVVDDRADDCEVVGAGVLDAAACAQDAELATLLTTAGHDPASAVLLRSFVIGNAPGLRAYGRAGFTDAGQYLGGGAGPQRAMVAPCG